MPRKKKDDPSQLSLPLGESKSGKKPPKSKKEAPPEPLFLTGELLMDEIRELFDANTWSSDFDKFRRTVAEMRAITKALHEVDQEFMSLFIAQIHGMSACQLLSALILIGMKVERRMSQSSKLEDMFNCQM